MDDEYLWVGAMVPYKRPDLAVEAFNANGRKLLMVGQGSMLKSLKARARPNIRLEDFASVKVEKQDTEETRAFKVGWMLSLVSSDVWCI